MTVCSGFRSAAMCFVNKFFHASVIFVVIPVVLAGAGCSRPKPEAKKISSRWIPPGMLEDFAKGFKGGYPEFDQAGKPMPHGAPTAGTPDLPPVDSQDEFTALIQKAGYEPHAHDPGFFPFFESLPMSAAAGEDAGVAGKLSIFYIFIDKQLLFVAVVRPLRNEELPAFDPTAPNIDDDLYAPQLISKLQAANPANDSSRFYVRKLPAGVVQGKSLFMQPTIVLWQQYGNLNVTPKLVDAAMAQAVLVLRATKDIWR
jgi:hypothetical protein